MDVIIALVIGLLFGSGVMYFIMKAHRPKLVGDLMIDYSDPEGPYPFMALNTGFQVVEDSKAIALKVQKTNLLSRK